MAALPRASRAVAALLFAAGCSAASGVRIQADRNPAADFSRYARYAWATAPIGGGEWPARNDRTAFDWKVRSLVDEQLAQRGYGRGVPEQADVLVDYRVSTEDREVADTFTDYARYRSAGGSAGLGEAYIKGYQEGTLIVEVLDARTRKLVWYGSATAVVNPELREKRLPDAIRRMFERFPAR